MSGLYSVPDGVGAETRAQLHVSGLLVLLARGNEIYMFSQSQLVRSLHSANEWTPEAMSVAILSLKNQFEPIVRILNVFPWEPM